MSKLNRLVTMDAREIMYRVQEKFRSQAERLRSFASVDAGPADEVLDHFKNYLEHTAQPHFYFKTAGSERDRRLDFIRRTFPDWIDRAVEDAEQICRHKAQLLGFGEVDLGAVIDWHRDPLTGRSWRRRFWSDYDLVHDSAAGDPKVIHELNRHQQIAGLAKAYFLTGDERYSLEAVSQLDSWIDQNPPFMGVNWQSSLEIAIRAISWMWTIFLLLPSPSLTPAAASRVGRSLFAQIDHIDRYPSLFSSPNTHLIGEATALFVAGTVFQGVERAARWQRRGADWLIREMERQITRDGVHGELSSYYHCYTIDFYLQALTLAELNGFEFPEWMSKRLDQMMEFLRHFSRTDGTLPLLGDDDGGRALAIVAKDYRSCKFDEEMFWLRREGGHEPPPGQAGAAPRDTHSFHPAAGSCRLDETRALAEPAYSGYAVQRSGWGPHESQVIFDCGGLGMLNGGHGHADALSLVLNVGATEILTDPGTFVYNGSPEWRNFFRSTRAHTTVVVDDCDQSIPDGTFNWRKKAQCDVVQHLSNESFEYVAAEHDGYRDPPCNIVHRRRLLHVRPALWVVVDDLTSYPEGPAQPSMDAASECEPDAKRKRGSAQTQDRQPSRDEHLFDFYFHFPSNAQLSVQQENDAALRVNAGAGSARLQLLMSTSAVMKWKTIAGQVKPIQGWVSSLYGEKSPAPALRIGMRSLAPAYGMFIMSPSHSDADPDRAVAIRSCVTEGAALAYEAEHDDVKDIFVLSLRDQTIGIPDFTLRGRFFWIRRTKGRLTRILGIDCKEVRHRDALLLGDDAGRPHFEYVR